MVFFFFFFNDTATTEIYTLSLHDALPIYAAIIDRPLRRTASAAWGGAASHRGSSRIATRDRKSTRLNSSHGYISYAVFCLKKKKHVHVQHAVKIRVSGCLGEQLSPHLLAI